MIVSYSVQVLLLHKLRAETSIRTSVFQKLKEACMALFHIIS